MSGVRALADLGRGDAATAGPKGAHLGDLLRAGFAVPDGFVVTTGVYGALFGGPAVRERMDAVLAALQPDDPASLRRTSEAMRGLMAERAQDAPWAEAVEAEYASRGACRVAVRSSATAEDLPNASFAGQQSSYLNVRGAAALRNAVERCWSSLFSERALYYRQSRGIGHDVMSAVVVQDMVDARAAGVAFSINPTNGRRDELLIEASFGLGESVVSGEVTPDLYVVDRGTQTCCRRQVHEQAWGYYCDPSGGTVKCPIAEPGAPVLTDAEIRELAACVVRVEEHFGSPQDVEWAIDAEGRLRLLQARPVTAWA